MCPTYNTQKVSGSQMDAFVSPSRMKHSLSPRWLAIPICTCSNFPLDFGARMHILFIFKWRSFELINDHISLLNYFLVISRMVNNIEHIVYSTHVFLVFVLIFPPKDTLLKYRCPFKIIIKLGTHTLQKVFAAFGVSLCITLMSRAFVPFCIIVSLVNRSCITA